MSSSSPKRALKIKKKVVSPNFIYWKLHEVLLPHSQVLLIYFKKIVIFLSKCTIQKGLPSHRKVKVVQSSQ